MNFGFLLGDEKSNSIGGVPNSQLIAMLAAAFIRHGVNLSVLADEDVKLFLRHVLGQSVTEDHLFNKVAYPLEKKLKQWVR